MIRTLRLLLLTLLFLIFQGLSPFSRTDAAPKSNARRRTPRAHPRTGAAPPGAQARIYLERFPTKQEAARLDTGAPFEPPVGCYLGAFIDFDPKLRHNVPHMGGHRDPRGFESKVGRSHAMYFFYMGYGQRVPIAWIRWLGQHQKFVHIALEPNSGMNKVRDDAVLHRLADDLAATHATIFLRFASEMNGDWTPYHKNPALYRRAFRLVHSVMRRRAPNVALVWCPYMEPTNNIASYYPGDDGTDWVGVNLYSVTVHNNRPDAVAENEHPCDLLETVYRRYAARRPMMICEFAASHFAACEGRPRPNFASRKILTLYNALPRLYPRVKCINYFDSNNLRYVATRAYNDYSVTDEQTVNFAYRTSIAPAYFLDAPQSRKGFRIPPMPMPLHSGETIRGRVRLSCWARTPSDVLIVRYKLDGRPIYMANSPDLWGFDFDASRIAPGRHTLTLEVLHPDGRRATLQSLTIVIQH